MIILQIQADNAILMRPAKVFPHPDRPNLNRHARTIMASRQIRPIRVEGNIAYVPLTQGYEAIIDAADVPLVEGHNWRSDIALRPDGSVRAVYAIRIYCANGRQNKVRMHRLISGVAGHLEVDHINGIGLDNRRINLRAATKAQNQHNQRISLRNTSGVKGVTWHERDKRWLARITVGGKRIHLGSFINITTAGDAYAKASENYHGKFGRTDRMGGGE